MGIKPSTRIKLNPNNSFAYNRRGIAFYSVGADYTRTTSFSDIDVNIVRTFLDRSIADFEEALRIEPSNTVYKRKS